MTEENRKDSRDREPFEALSHPTRIKILQALSKSPMGYADLKREVGLESSGLLSFHLGKLTCLVEMEGGKYALTDEGRGALKTIITEEAARMSPSNVPTIRCSNCGSIMENYGKQAFRTGAINEAVSALVSLEWGMPIQFETCVCKKCGKVELFADDTARKLMRGEYAGDSLIKCPSCQKQYAKDIERCPYCGEMSPRFKTKP